MATAWSKIKTNKDWIIGDLLQCDKDSSWMKKIFLCTLFIHSEQHCWVHRVGSVRKSASHNWKDVTFSMPQTSFSKWCNNTALRLKITFLYCYVAGDFHPSAHTHHIQQQESLRCEYYYPVLMCVCVHCWTELWKWISSLKSLKSKASSQRSLFCFCLFVFYCYSWCHLGDGTAQILIRPLWPTEE